MTWWEAHTERLIAHYAHYAMQPGLKAYVWQQIKDIARDNPTLRDELPEQFLARVGIAKQAKEIEQ